MAVILSLPMELQHAIIEYLGPKDLVLLSTTCTFFRSHPFIAHRIYKALDLRSENFSWMEIKTILSRHPFPTNLAMKNLERMIHFKRTNKHLWQEVNLCAFTLNLSIDFFGLLHAKSTELNSTVSFRLKKIHPDRIFYDLSVELPQNVSEFQAKVLNRTTEVFNELLVPKSNQRTAIQQEYHFVCNGCKPHAIFTRENYLAALWEFKPLEISSRSLKSIKEKTIQCVSLLLNVFSKS